MQKIVLYQTNYSTNWKFWAFWDVTATSWQYTKVTSRIMGISCKSKWKFQFFRDSLTVSNVNISLKNRILHRILKIFWWLFRLLKRRIFGRNINFICYSRLLSNYFFGLGYFLKKAAMASDPTVEVTNSGNKWKIVTTTILKTMTLEFEMVNAFKCRVIHEGTWTRNTLEEPSLSKSFNLILKPNYFKKQRSLSSILLT